MLYTYTYANLDFRRKKTFFKSFVNLLLKSDFHFSRMKEI